MVEAADLGEQETMALAVTAIPDPKRQERLIVVHTDALNSPEDLCKARAAGPLPKPWLPSPEDFVRVEAIPVLGTGKVDLRGLRSIGRSSA